MDDDFLDDSRRATGSHTDHTLMKQMELDEVFPSFDQADDSAQPDEDGTRRGAVSVFAESVLWFFLFWFPVGFCRACGVGLFFFVGSPLCAC